MWYLKYQQKSKTIRVTPIRCHLFFCLISTSSINFPKHPHLTSRQLTLNFAPINPVNKWLVSKNSRVSWRRNDIFTANLLTHYLHSLYQDKLMILCRFLGSRPAKLFHNSVHIPKQIRMEKRVSVSSIKRLTQRSPAAIFAAPAMQSVPKQDFQPLASMP